MGAVYHLIFNVDTPCLGDRCALYITFLFKVDTPCYPQCTGYLFVKVIYGVENPSVQGGTAHPLQNFTLLLVRFAIQTPSF